MKNILSMLWLLAVSLSAVTGSAAETPKHLFILSGQSNMAGMNPAVSFMPTVEKAFGKENVLVVKSAQGGQPIRRWFKEYQYPDKREITDKAQIGDLYDVLMKAVKAGMGNNTYNTVTFCWMQGERDAKEGLAEVYEASFKGILAQLKRDLNITEINFVIGRLSDFGNDNKAYPDWMKIRDIQVKLARDDKRGQWIDCDDLNEGVNGKGVEIKNDLHMSVDGYKKMGERFAEKAIALINGTAKDD